MPQLDIQRRYRSMNDVRQRHNGTFVGLIQRDGTVKPYFVRECTGELSDCRVLMVDIDGRDKHINIQSEDLILDRPDCGFANLPLSGGAIGAVYHSTTAARQYKRSLNYGNLHRFYVGRYVMERFAGHGSDKYRAVSQFYNDDYPQFQQALAQIQNGDAFSIAFSRKFALCIHETKGIVIYYKQQIVGYIDSESEPQLVPAFQHLNEQLEEAVC